jgi:hypothetical protein
MRTCRGRRLCATIWQTWARWLQLVGLRGTPRAEMGALPPSAPSSLMDRYTRPLPSSQSSTLAVPNLTSGQHDPLRSSEPGFRGHA